MSANKDRKRSVFSLRLPYFERAQLEAAVAKLYVDPTRRTRALGRFIRQAAMDHAREVLGVLEAQRISRAAIERRFPTRWAGSIPGPGNTESRDRAPARGPE
jgi:GNAT superfamily N-acetyltransferase